MAPKQRYLSLYRAMGESWLWYTVTASDQLQMAIARDEMTSLLNFGNLMTPVIIALCANSPVYAGKLSPYCSAREGVMAAIRANEHRHGMIARPMQDVADFVATHVPAHLFDHAGQRPDHPQLGALSRPIWRATGRIMGLSSFTSTTSGTARGSGRPTARWRCALRASSPGASTWPPAH